ncbi:ribonuclease P protein component [Solwaraspora sp. WMMB335]|uniref:ribonuclease P protein component n=1 Tax=Solwaraspora sp. WMMB335 TaxID=3404118 RepID=UPI003B95EE37
MLAADQRVRHRADFTDVMRGGRRAGRDSLVVHLLLPSVAGPDSRRVPARAGFIVSRAVGNAVTRNTVRRRLRHLVRARLPHLPAGTMLVVRALPAAAGRPATRLAADLDAALRVARSARPAGRSSGRRTRRSPSGAGGGPGEAQ